MGIRKHFEGMKDEKEMKLSDFGMGEEKKSKKLDFDPERDISEERINRMKEMVLQGAEEERDDKFWEYGESAAYFKILFPERFDEDVFREAWQDKMLEKLKKLKRSGLNTVDGLYNFIVYAGRFGLLFPDKIDDLNIDDEMFDKRMERERFFITAQRLFDLVIDNLFRLAVLFPGRIKECRAVVESNWDKIEKKLAEELDEGELVECVANLKILTFRRIEVSKKEWENEKKILIDGFGEGDSESLVVFGRAAVNLAMLAAEEVKLTDDGLELVMEKEDFRTERKKRPVRKNF